MPGGRIPKSISQFVEQQSTKPVENFSPESAEPSGIPYTEYWRRAIALMLLSGRVSAKNDGTPNQTDAHRFGKEANFNPYLLGQVGEFFVFAGILDPGRYGSKYYQPGEWAEAFWNRDVPGLQQASRQAFRKYIETFSSETIKRARKNPVPQLDMVLMLFGKAFQGLAVPWKTWGPLLREFIQLPAKDLKSLAKQVGHPVEETHITSWREWLDELGQEAFMAALTCCDWAYVDDDKNPKWIYLSETARMMLGLKKPPKPLALVRDFQVQPDRTILAGADWEPEKLLPLFRYCQVNRIDRVLEFQLNKKQMVTLPSETSAAQELREVLKELKPWPSPVENFLDGGPKLKTGVVRIGGCSAIVRPENAEVLESIKAHPRLKNYLESKPPDGYLVIKSESDPLNFVARYRELGFEVKPL